MTQQTALAKVPAQTSLLAKEFEVSESYIQTVKDTIAKGATDNELYLFLQTAKRTGLDPLARQIYCIKRYSGGKEVMSVQISIDGFRAIADRTGKYVPSKEPTYTFDSDRNLESATAYIKKFVAGTWHEISATAFYDEYVQTTKDGNPNSMWRKMPRLMLAKTAESLVLRKAFPAELSGLYTVDELPPPDDQEIHSEPASVMPIAKPQLAESAKPTPAQNPLDAQIAELGGNLNKAFDTKVWTGKHITEHARMLLEDESIESYKFLDDERKNILIGDLSATLEERLAINEVNSGEAIEAEVVE